MKPKQTVKQNLSKDMKKQGHTGAKKPSNKKLDAEKALAEKPKKGTFREPSSKKLSSETSLQKSHKLVHIKEFLNFESLIKENNESENIVKVKDLIEYLETLNPEMEIIPPTLGWGGRGSKNPFDIFDIIEDDNGKDCLYMF